jgi:hypothetical protein
VVDRKFINDLPLIDRDVMDLTMLTPGVTEADDQCVGCGGTNFVSNGSRNATADILMDGATVTNYEPNGGVTEMTYTPSSEAVEEFRVEQSNFSAEYGFSGASVVNMITRSGSNSFHGSGYDFARNKITDANGWFANLNGDPLPAVHRHNFGGTVSGPSSRTRPSFSLTMMVRARARQAHPRLAFPPTPSATMATLARFAPTTADRSTIPASAVLRRGRFGIRILEPTSKLGIMGRERCAALSFLTTISAPTPAREMPNCRLGSSCRGGKAT